MIFVEQHILDIKTMMPIASFSKTFMSLSEFTKFYKLAKLDPCVIINVLTYNPQENPGQKSSYDLKLYSMSREVEI
jgi:hypothetical protein